VNEEQPYCVFVNWHVHTADTNWIKRSSYCWTDWLHSAAVSLGSQHYRHVYSV